MRERLLRGQQVKCTGGSGRKGLSWEAVGAHGPNMAGEKTLALRTDGSDSVNMPLQPESYQWLIQAGHRQCTHGCLAE